MALIKSDTHRNGDDEPEYEFVWLDPETPDGEQADQSPPDPTPRSPLQDPTDTDKANANTSRATNSSDEPSLWQLAGRSIKKHKAGRIVINGIRDSAKESKRAVQQVVRDTQKRLGAPKESNPSVE